MVSTPNVYTMGSHMTRTQVYLTEEQRVRLREQAARSGRPQSDLIREALDDYLRRHAQERRKEVLDEAAGIWAERDDLQALYSARETMDRALSQ